MKGMEQEFIFKVVEVNESYTLPESESIWIKNIGHKINVMSNYHDLTLTDREILLKLLNEWVIKEINIINNIKK